ncbi:MAG: hypothetical protein F4Y02_03760, partial [Chloroflexi bacterium]|nr:hypothetical protein [Chloroflexota bacterium]
MKERLEIIMPRARMLPRKLAAFRRKPDVESPSQHEASAGDPGTPPAAPGEPGERIARFSLVTVSLSALKRHALGIVGHLRRTRVPSISQLKERVLSLPGGFRRVASQKSNSQAEPGEEPATPAPKPPPDLPLFFMLSHLEEDGPVRQDNVKLGVCEVMGLEIDEPKLGAFAGALNACDFPFQLLIRQHPPRLGGLREKLQENQPDNLPPQTRVAAESLRRLLGDMERRDGILDRRFYAICEAARIDELRGLLARAGLSVHLLTGRQLRM